MKWVLLLSAFALAGCASPKPYESIKEEPRAKVTASKSAPKDRVRMIVFKPNTDCGFANAGDLLSTGATATKRAVYMPAGRAYFRISAYGKTRDRSFVLQPGQEYQIAVVYQGLIKGSIYILGKGAVPRSRVKYKIDYLNASTGQKVKTDDFSICKKERQQ